MKNKNVVFGMVADNTPKYLGQALRLVQSIRWFGGACANADVIVCAVEELDETYRHEFERYGAEIRLVSKYNAKHPQSNKLQFLAFDDLQEYDAIILFDCDTLIVQDPSRCLDRKTFCAKIADAPTISYNLFKKIFAFFDIPLPEPLYQCTVRGELTIPYFNAGVLIFSKTCLKTLIPAWRMFNDELLTHFDLLEDSTNFCEQASLSLAIAATSAPFEILGNEMNFPLHFEHLEEPYRTELSVVDPVIIHYHWLVDPSGYLLPSEYPLANQRIIQFNQRLRLERERHFDNRLFWNDRYTTNPELGSGLGSRAEYKTYKRELLQHIVATWQPTSILDVGCGDMHISEVLPPHGYIGMDISEIIQQKNREQYPDRTFIQGDFLQIAAPNADVTVCLDVLIHLTHCEAYQAFVKKFVEHTQRVGIIAGYEHDPGQKGIVFFHEPLSQTLRALGVSHIEVLGGYRGATIFQFQISPHAVKQSSLSDEKSISHQNRLLKGALSFLASSFAKPVNQTVLPYLPDALKAKLRPWAFYLLSKIEPQHEILHRPIFIVGTMRSGTTLLAQLLGSHPDIVYCPFELKDLWSHYGGAPMASPKTKDTNCPELGEGDVRFGQKESLQRAFLKRMEAHRSGKTSQAVFLNKNPHLCNKLPFVKALFPDARFIWILRDLPQVAVSLKRLFLDVYERQQVIHYWPEPQKEVITRCWSAYYSSKDIPGDVSHERLFPGGRLSYLAEYWLETNLAVSGFFSTLPVTQKLVIQQENIVANLADVLAQCLAFLQIPLIDLSNHCSIDSSRNSQWRLLATPDEIRELLLFVDTHSELINSIIPKKIQAPKYVERLQDVSIH